MLYHVATYRRRRFSMVIAFLIFNVLSILLGAYITITIDAYVLYCDMLLLLNDNFQMKNCDIFLLEQK